MNRRSWLRHAPDLAPIGVLLVALIALNRDCAIVGIPLALMGAGWALSRLAARAGGSSTRSGAGTVDRTLVQLERKLASRHTMSIADLVTAIALGQGSAGLSDRARDARDEMLAMLPAMGRADYSALDLRDRAALLSLVTLTDIPAIALELVALIERAEDTLALPHIRRISEGHCRTAADARVVEAARRCLPVLEEAQRREQEAAKLLRPAAHPPDTLLRAASGAPETSEERLLRPALGGDDGVHREHVR